MAGSIQGDTFIGQKQQQLRGLLKLSYPMAHGIVTNWEEMEKIWQFVYTDTLNVLSEDHPLLITEAPHNPKRNRERMAQVTLI